jgi:hypothetical protein
VSKRSGITAEPQGIFIIESWLSLVKVVGLIEIALSVSLRASLLSQSPSIPNDPERRRPTTPDAPEG